jgi:Cu(I)/Ag(I) efflux system membrane fusion protein
MMFITVIALMMVVGSCKNGKPHEHAKANVDSYYTCSMHPQVMQPGPGKCPICGMTLIKVEKTIAPKADEIQLSDQQIQLGNISVDTIRSGSLGDQVVLTATINFNQAKSTAISSRIMGRIERLYFKNIGDYVRKGDKVFDIYSEDLNNAKQEYILALERQKTLDNTIIDFAQLIESAKNKLRLWGLSEAQISELATINKATPTTTFYSSGSGYVTTLDIREGDYVMEGGMIMHLADLSTLWVEAQVYTSELFKIDRNGMATVQIPDMPGKEISGKIEFVNPEISPDTRINLIRVSIPNIGNRLKPGMPAYVLIKSRQRNALTLPIDAVIRDANGATVWVKTGKNTFKSKMVTVGLESDDRIEITGGLNADDVVVISGAYLINSEYIFKKGANPMAGHDMGNM